MAEAKFSVKLLPPDGGWGYVVIFGMVLCMMLFGLGCLSFGIIYIMLLEQFDTSATVVSSIGAVNVLVWGFFGPVASQISTHLGCRWSVMIGSILQSVGFILTGFAPDIIFVFVSLGVLAGVGMSLCTTACYLIVSQYFDKRRALATSIGSCGGALAMVIMPPVIKIITETYSFTGSMLLIGGFCLHGLISAALFRPVPSIKIPRSQLSAGTDTQYDKEPCLCHLEDKINMETHVDDKVQLAKEKSHMMEYNKDTYTVPSQESSGIAKGDTERDQANVPFVSSHSTQSAKHNIQLSEKDISISASPQSSYYIAVTNPIVVAILLINLFAAAMSAAMTVFTPVFVLENGISRTLAYWMVSIFGIADAVGRIGWGFFFDLPKIRVNILYFYGLFGCIGSVGCGLLPVIPTYSYYLLMWITHALTLGIVFAQRTTVLMHTVGVHHTPAIFGLVQTSNAIGQTAGRAIGGVLRDSTGVYDYVYYITGVLGLLSSIFILVAVLQSKRRTTQ